MKKIFALMLCLVLLVGMLSNFSAMAAEAPTFTGTAVTDLQWADGTFYDGAVGNGNGKYIYTTLTLAKGEKVQFEIPGVWNLWVYPAVNGVATGEYRGGNGGKKIANGEIITYADNVTELRITAYIEGGASANVASEAFKTLDLKFYKVTGGDSDKIVDTTGREWQKGAFYNTAEPDTSVATTRRYTVLPVSEGQTVKFTMTEGTWRVWVYYADANGSIGGKYFEAKNGTEYKVEAIDGKMPTNLRLTACIEKTITDEDWAKFDLKIDVTDPKIVDKNGREWQKGSFYAGAQPDTSVATTRRYTVLPVSEGQTVKFNLVEGTWRVWVYYADANGSIGGKYFEAKNGTEYKVEAIDGKMPTNLRLTACIEKSITDEDWAKFDLKIDVTDPKIVDKSGREWEKGAFYDTAAPNTSVATTRRYTVLPVSEGQTVKFTMTEGTWRVWVYYADANGSIGGKYVEAKNGTEIKIEAIDGRIPTNLRLTACIEKSITAEDWAKFDLAIETTSMNPDTDDVVLTSSVIAMLIALAVGSGVVVLRNKKEQF